MALFDELDALAGAAVGRVFADQVIWRPMLARPGGSYTSPGETPDPNRPVREIPAIVSWAIISMPIESSPGGGLVAGGTLLIDFEDALFLDEQWVQYGRPKKPDRIELPFEKEPANRMGQIERVGDDGSARFFAWVRLVQGASA